MAISNTNVELRKDDIETGTPVDCNLEVFSADEIILYYGNARETAVVDTDYTVALDNANDAEPEWPTTFSFTPLASLLTKIGDLIAADETEENVVFVRRELDYTTDFNETDAFLRSKITREFDRTIMRFQQLSYDVQSLLTVKSDAEAAEEAAADSATEADASAMEADASATEADASATLASQWAELLNGLVASVGFSAKEWAVGVYTRGTAGLGSAKDWATYVGGTVDDVGYSAKYWAQAALAYATQAASAVFSASPLVNGVWHWGGDAACLVNQSTSGGTYAGGVDTTSATLPELVVNYGLYANHGSGNPSTAYKVTAGYWIIAGPNAANSYALNGIFHANAGFAKLGTAQELDINNQSGTDYGFSTIGSGADIHGQALVSGGSPNAISTAQWIFGLSNAAYKHFSNGVTATGNYTINNLSSVNAFLQDATLSPNVLRATNAHVKGLNLESATFSSGYAITLPNNHSLGFMNAASNAILRGMSLSAGNTLTVGTGLNNLVLDVGGTGFGTYVSCNGDVYPFADNTFKLGTGGARWSAVYAANGTIQTSDPSLKTDIKPLPNIKDIITKVNPVTFKWKSGGLVAEEYEEYEDVPVTESVKELTPKIVLKDGVATEVQEETYVDKPVLDEYEVVDKDGKPVYEYVPGQTAMLDEKGRVVVPAREAAKVRKVHAVQRTERRLVKKVRYIERAGARTHWGFLATEVRDAFAATGIDFGGYVYDKENERHCLRPDQLIAPMWKAMQEMTEEIDRLKAEVSALKGS